MMGKKTKEDFVVLGNCLHMRPSGQLSKAVKESGLSATMQFDDKTADMSSALDLLQLGASAGQKVLVIIEYELDNQAKAEQLMSEIEQILLLAVGSA